MSIKVGINGFGRIGKLALRAAWDWPELEFVQINDPGGDAATHAHLLNFDSVHGRWHHEARGAEGALVIGNRHLPLSANRAIADTDWSGCDLVIEASGANKTSAVLQGYLDQGVAMGIKHGSITTIHDVTNTQSILDQPHKDLRRARACGMSLIPTSTGSATAIAEIFPELRGKLNGHAVRVPLANASLTDCVFEVARETSVEEVNQLFKAAAVGAMQGILGYEERPLVSIDYRTDPRSSIIDALSTMVVNGTQVKIYSWYDNEWGYSNRLVELGRLVGQAG